MEAQSNPVQSPNTGVNFPATGGATHDAALQNAPVSSAKGVLVVSGILFVAFAGFMGMRVVEAGKKQQALAADRAAAEAEQIKKPSYGTVTPKPVKFRPSVEITGTLKPWREAEVNFEAAGRVQDVPVRLGDAVESGDLLATLDASIAGAQVNQASAQVKGAAAQVAMAEDNWKRTQALVESKSIPEASLEAAKQQLAAAKAGLEAASATTQLAKVGQGKMALRAPFDGILTRAPASGGFFVNPGMPGQAPFRIEDVSHFRLAGSVSEADFDLVKVGAAVGVLWKERVVAGKVSAVVPSLDPMTRRAPVEIEVPNDPKNPILGYGFVHVKIDGPAEVDALEVPITAKRAGSQDEVVVVSGGKAKTVRVVHDTKADGSWLVRSGLQAGDVLLLNAPPELKDGEDVLLKGQ